jgi:hypothetical protein
VQDGLEECDDDNLIDDDGCANDCTANNCLQGWMDGELMCNPIHGACEDSETGYHWKGLFLSNNVQYACWWHTKNQGWNTTANTNFFALAEHFLLATGVGGSTRTTPVSSRVATPRRCVGRPRWRWRPRMPPPSG